MTSKIESSHIGPMNLERDCRLTSWRRENPRRRIWKRYDILFSPTIAL